jgi:hypothetical protein
MAGGGGAAAAWVAGMDGLENHAAALAAGRNPSITRLIKGEEAAESGVGWGRRAAAAQSTPTTLQQPAVRMSRPSSRLVHHLCRPRTYGRSRRPFRHQRTAPPYYCNGSESFVPALVCPSVVRPTSPCSVRGFQFPINSPSNRSTV